jgi:hypothetical protein
MKVLIYKRTHKGDPDERGVFGNQDCMGTIRNWNYDAVIGIGGNAPWKEDADIKHKINWIGKGPKKINSHSKRGPIVVFSKFQLFEDTGLPLKDHYPNLFQYMFGNRKRFSMSDALPQNVFEEVMHILDSINDCPPSKMYHMDVDTTTVVHHESECKSGCFKGEKVELEIC